jgi:hypothetical protein
VIRIFWWDILYWIPHVAPLSNFCSKISTDRRAIKHHFCAIKSACDTHNVISTKQKSVEPLSSCNFNCSQHSQRLHSSSVTGTVSTQTHTTLNWTPCVYSCSLHDLTIAMCFYLWCFIAFSGCALLQKLHYNATSNHVSPHHEPPIAVHVLFVMLFFLWCKRSPNHGIRTMAGLISPTPLLCHLLICLHVLRDCLLVVFIASKLLIAHALFIDASMHSFFRCHPTNVPGKSMIKSWVKL